jgi:hypothetical protein
MIAKKLIVNPDHFNLSVEQLYTMLCKKILEKKIVKSIYEKVPYEIYSADHAGIQFVRLETDKEQHLLKQEMIALLDNIKKTHEFRMQDVKVLAEKKQIPAVAFLLVGDIIY